MRLDADTDPIVRYRIRIDNINLLPKKISKL